MSNFDEDGIRGGQEDFSYVNEEVNANVCLVSDVQQYVQDKDEDKIADTETRLEDSSSFHVLCDGVINAVALVHEALQNLLEFKDEMLGHALPPTVLSHLALVTGQIYRSISDLGVPLGELVRLVRVYSSPWKDQTIALQRLHESYAAKDRQLSIAIKRLQLFDKQSKQMAKERRIMNWEKLFLNVTNAKSHGRQWKFIIEAIKQKAKLGREHVQAYTKHLDDEPFAAAEEENDNEDEDSKAQDLLGVRVSDVEDHSEGPHPVSSEEAKYDHIEEAPVTEVRARNVQSGNMRTIQTGNTRTVQSVHMTSKVYMPTEKSVTIKLPTQDAQTWTHEPEFDRFLFVRIFCPEGLKKPKLKCSLSYNGNIIKTPILDNKIDETSNENMSDFTHEKPSERSIGQHIEKPQAAQNIVNRAFNTVLSKPEPQSRQQKRYYEINIQLPDIAKEGVLVTSKQLLSEPETLKFAVHHGKFEEIVAMTSIDFTDIKQMNLETVYLPPPHGDDDVPFKSSRTNSFSLDNDSLCDSVDIPIVGDDQSDHLRTASLHEDLIKSHIPQLLHLYSLNSGISESAEKVCGHVPVLMYWGMRSRPLHFNRQCGIRGPLNITGIDHVTTTSEELVKETVDEALSAITYTPEAEEEMVLKSDYDMMVELHQQDLVRIQTDYEKQIEELTNNIEALKANPPASSNQSRPVSKTSAYGRMSPITRRSLSNMDRAGIDNLRRDLPGSATSRQKPMGSKAQKPTKNFRIGHRLPQWGEHLPQDFLERLSQWAEESKQHKQELSEKTLKDMKDNIERKLAGEYKLSKCEEQICDVLKDVSLPAMFMPFKTGSVYNPRAHKYFHPTGTSGVRLSQPPSVFQLPPLENCKLSVANLFELSKNFHIRGPTWLVEQYINSLEQLQQDILSSSPPVTTSDKTPFSENSK